MLNQNNFQNQCLPHQYPQQEYPPQQPVQGIPVNVPIHSIPESNKNCYRQCCRIAGITGIVLSIIIIVFAIIAMTTTDCDDPENSDIGICNDDTDYDPVGMYG